MVAQEEVPGAKRAGPQVSLRNGEGGSDLNWLEPISLVLYINASIRLASPLAGGSQKAGPLFWTLLRASAWTVPDSQKTLKRHQVEMAGAECK